MLQKSSTQHEIHGGSNGGNDATFLWLDVW